MKLVHDFIFNKYIFYVINDLYWDKNKFINPIIGQIIGNKFRKSFFSNKDTKKENEHIDSMQMTHCTGPWSSIRSPRKIDNGPAEIIIKAFKKLLPKKALIRMLVKVKINKILIKFFMDFSGSFSVGLGCGKFHGNLFNTLPDERLSKTSCSGNEHKFPWNLSML